MDVREKLVELIDDFIHNVELKHWYSEELDEKLADDLIAHGVTVREWISVKDRLPDDSTTVNLYTRSGIVGTGFYDKYTKIWVQYYSGGSICVDVTHWQPQPKPPKGGGGMTNDNNACKP